jgi:hypothetical protein
MHSSAPSPLVPPLALQRTCVVVERGIVPLVPRLQQHLAVLRHLAHVQPLPLAARVLAHGAQLGHQGRHIDEGIVICLQHKCGVVGGGSILQHLRAGRQAMAGVLVRPGCGRLEGGGS